jgi:hypothetical protein
MVIQGWSSRSGVTGDIVSNFDPIWWIWGVETALLLAARRSPGRIGCFHEGGAFSFILTVDHTLKVEGNCLKFLR